MHKYWFYKQYTSNGPKYHRPITPILDPYYMPPNRTYQSTPYSMFDRIKTTIKHKEDYKMSGSFK